MKTRREFMNSASRGVLAAAAFQTFVATECQENKEEKKIRIGIIGAENSHTIGFGKLFNVQKKFPGAEVLYVWGETDAFAKNAAEKGSIPNIVKDPAEMMGKIDALIVDHRHPKFHLEAALPFVKAGIPTFVDKPFCYRVSEGRAFLEMAEKFRTPVTSFSSIAQSDAVLDMKSQIPSMGTINHILMYGPADIKSPYGGIFFYGVHMVQPLLNVFGEDVEKVRVTRHGEKTTASVVFRSGYLATLIFLEGDERGIILLTEGGEKRLESRVEESDPPRHYRDIVEMFRTGKEPRTHKSILSCVAVLEALERSVETEIWEKVEMN